MGVVGDKHNQGQLAEGTTSQPTGSYEHNLQEIESFVGGLDMNSLQTLCVRMLEGQGGVSLAKSILDATLEQ